MNTVDQWARETRREIRHLAEAMPDGQRKQLALEYASAWDEWAANAQAEHAVIEFAQAWLWTIIIPLALVIWIVCYSSHRSQRLFLKLQKAQADYYGFREQA